MKSARYLLIAIAAITMFQSCTLVDHAPQPTVDFTVSQEQEGRVVFNLISSNTDSYLWNFGDGESSTERSPTHTYKNNGKFYVTVTASGNEGQVSVKKEISVTDITGSAVFYTYDLKGLPVEVFVDDVLIGTATVPYRVLRPTCGDYGVPTAYKLTEGIHKYEYRQIERPNPQTQRGSFTVIGGKCTTHHFYFPI